MIKKTLYIDDIRQPKTNFTKIVRTCEEGQLYIKEHGMPDFISFDHDLGMVNGEERKSGYDFAKWIVDSDLDGDIDIPNDFNFNVHSANPVGAEKIKSILNGYLKFKKEQLI